ncbi:MAG: hypothetical protein LBH44_07575 [Treponema sp.]|jgi:hypothetical protein|nr:hypothetical protein [Treponema sp.]
MGKPKKRVEDLSPRQLEEAMRTIERAAKSGFVPPVDFIGWDISEADRKKLSGMLAAKEVIDRLLAEAREAHGRGGV